MRSSGRAAAKAGRSTVLNGGKRLHHDTPGAPSASALCRCFGRPDRRFGRASAGSPVRVEGRHARGLEVGSDRAFKMGIKGSTTGEESLSTTAASRARETCSAPKGEGSRFKIARAHSSTSFAAGDRASRGLGLEAHGRHRNLRADRNMGEGGGPRVTWAQGPNRRSFQLDRRACWADWRPSARRGGRRACSTKVGGLSDEDRHRARSWTKAIQRDGQSSTAPSGDSEEVTDRLPGRCSAALRGVHPAEYPRCRSRRDIDGVARDSFTPRIYEVGGGGRKNQVQGS